MTANLRVNTPDDGENAWPFRVESMADVFRSHGPLVVGTQEGLPSMLQDLSQRLSDYAYIGHARAGGDETEYCAIFYKTDSVSVEDSGQFWLSETPDVPGSSSWGSAFPRICTWGIFSLKEQGDLKFAVYNTHLDHISDLARLNGAHVIKERLRKQFANHPMPVILMGDLNAEPDSPVIQYLRDNANEAAIVDVSTTLTEPICKTFHAFREDTSGESIDYIFVSPDITVEQVTVDRTKHLGKYPSDHFPVIARLVL